MKSRSYRVIVAAISLCIGLAFFSVSVYAQFAPTKIMFLGDSITYDQHVVETRTIGVRTGFRAPLWHLLIDAGYYVDFVGSRIAGQNILPAFDPDNEGYPGWRDDEIAAVVYNLLVQNPPDVVCLHIGTNGLDTSSADVANILDEIDRFETDYGHPITVVLARIINRSTYSSTTTTFNNNVAAMANQRIQAGDNIVIVDMENGAGIDYRLQSSGGDMYDNYHPAQSGYDKMAAKWMEALTQFLPLPTETVPPIINTIPSLTTAYVGELYSYNLVANGSPVLLHTLTSAPQGMTIDPTTGRIEWTPVQTGIAQVSAAVSNGVFPDATQDFELNVEAQRPVTVLASGDSVSGSVAEGEWAYYQIQAASTDTQIAVQMSNLSADVDLYVRNGAQVTTSDYDCRPYLGGTNAETCTLPSTGDTTWYIGVYGYRAGSFTITANLTGAIVLNSGQSQSGSVALGEWDYYLIHATTTDTELTVDLTNLSADVDLYVRNGTAPTKTLFDCRPYLGGTNAETCTLPNTGDTTWYIGVNGYRSGSFSIKARLKGATANQPPVLDPIGAQSVTEGQQLLIPVSASDADGPAPLVLDATNLPPGATFTDFGGGSGQFAWTPAAGNAAGSPYTVSFTATDDGGNGLSDSESVSITVNQSTGGGALVLNSGASQSGAVAQGDWLYYMINTTAADTELVADLTNLSADVDLYVRKGALPTTTVYDCRPYRGGTNSENCTMENPGDATWYIGVNGYRAGSFTITATRVAPTPLVSGAIQSGSLAQGEWDYYVINAGAQNTQLVVNLTNLSADIDLYVRSGGQPTTNLYDCRPYSGGRTAETCTLPNSGQNTWYIGINGYRAGSYSVTATLY